MWSGMRRPRSCIASTGSGGWRRPSVPTTRGCARARDGAGERRRKPSGSAPAASQDEARDAPAPPRSGPPAQNRRNGAPRGDARCRRPRTPQAVRDKRPRCACRRVIPLGVRGANRKARFARRRDADGAWPQDGFSARGCWRMAWEARQGKHTQLSSPAKAGDPANGDGHDKSQLRVYRIPAFAGTTWEWAAATPRVR